VTTLVIYKTYLLASDGRYVSFPFELAVIPVTGLLGLFIICSFENKQARLAYFNFNSLIGAGLANDQRNRQIGWLLLFYIAGMVAGEIKAFMVGRDFIASYPDIGDRLTWAVKYTVTNCQLLDWLGCLGILALAFLVNTNNNGEAKAGVVTH
jgi:hypothetical protein